MKRQLDWFAGVRRRTIEAGALLALSAVALLLGQAWADGAQAQTAPPAAAAAATASGGARAPAGGIDTLIQHLHDTFKITPAQEPLWRKVADVMRSNAETMIRLAKARSESAATATAMDDLKSYSEISEAHAAGTRKMIPVFQALYDTMSVDQRKAADAEFRDHYRGRHQPAH